MKYFFTAVFVFGAMLAIFAVGAGAQSSGNNRPDPAQLARGAQAWARECGRCHNLRSPSELTDEEWIVSTTHMRVRANIPGDIIRDIQVFLKNANRSN